MTPSLTFVLTGAAGGIRTQDPLLRGHAAADRRRRPDDDRRSSHAGLIETQPRVSGKVRHPQLTLLDGWNGKGVTDEEMKRIHALKRPDGRIANPKGRAPAWD